MAGDDNRAMNPPSPIAGAVRLAHLGVIRARGADAPKFLQGQLTNDVASLKSDAARLAGFCSAKGRLQASFVVCRAGADDYLLVCAASVLPAALKRLSMFVMRAQCKLSDASDDLAVTGIAGSAAGGLIGDAAVWSASEIEGATVIRLPDVDGNTRALRLAPPDAADAWPAVDLDDWRALEVRSGLALIEAETVDRFVPQMLNFELVGGVDFQKGCYPGQEVVARSQYRGTIKRRMFLFETDGEAAPGQEVFHSADVDQPAGMVVNAARLQDGAGSVALVEVKWATLEAGTLHLAAPAGALLRRVDLPYEVPLEASAER